MLKAIRQKFEEKRASWALETENRINEYSVQKRADALSKLKKEEEINHLLHQEMENYLYTIHPSFLLKPEVAKALHNRLLARSQGKFCVAVHVTSDMRMALDFYNSDLSIFIRLLEKKGFKLNGNEERFLTAFLNKLSENNYRLFMDRFGDFVNEHDNIDAAFIKYLELVEDHRKYDHGQLDFLNKYFINKGVVAPDCTKRKLKKLVKSFEKAHATEYKLTRLEKRMHG
ncbi:hypothetical protein [Alteribacillus sp. HJP-4]|uniref:hypothetical protein n=1 Tax=Alteribacillus sp. HJP-4 TaxID=2775394 RepID=UPI0035CD1AD4